MVKKVIKETAIVLLLCIAIILVLGLLFYQYIPSNKIIPNKVAYQMPENVAEELNNNLDEASFVNITYTLDSSEINMSRKTKDYNPGKQNPFSSIEAENTNTTGNTTNTNSNSGSSNTNEQGSSDSGSYLPSGGAK